MPETTPAERALLDYVYDHTVSGRFLDDTLQRLVAAVRSPRTWPGALSAEECAERYPECWHEYKNHPPGLPQTSASGWAHLVTALNRARADGIEWAAEQSDDGDAHIESQRGWRSYATEFLRSLLPKDKP